MNKRFSIVKGNPSREELAALSKVIRKPVAKKAERASLWRKSQLQQPLPHNWKQTF